MSELKTEPAVELDEIKWVYIKDVPRRFASDPTQKEETLEMWRQKADVEGDAPFPDKDSNNNPCRVLTYVPDGNPSNNLYISDNLALHVVYPNGKVRKLLNYTYWKQHAVEKGFKLSHFALAVLAAWPTGDERELQHRWNIGSEAVNAANTLSPAMWIRAFIQGYISAPAGVPITTTVKMLRTNKKVNANLSKSRKTKKSAWPFSEKVHWFNIMSGALQITHNNMSEVIRGGGPSNLSTRDSNKKLKVLKDSYPVFKSCPDFKKARKFFEGISEKKNPDKAYRCYANEVPGSGGRFWDPLKNLYHSGSVRSHVSRRSYSDFFSNAYALVRTSIMLGCVPEIEENGSILNFQKITPEYLKCVNQEEVMQKSVIGTWGRSSRHSQHNSIVWAENVYNRMNVDNLTHMYMILLNETGLLSNNDLLKWCDRQELNLHKENFNTVFSLSYNFEVFGYKLTNTLDYTCVVLGEPTSSSDSEKD